MAHLIKNINNVQQNDQQFNSRERFLKRLGAAGENFEHATEDLPNIEYEEAEVAIKNVSFFHNTIFMFKSALILFCFRKCPNELKILKTINNIICQQPPDNVF